MVNWDPKQSPEIAAACNTGAEAAGRAIAQVFGTAVTAASAELSTFAEGGFAESLRGAGLIFVLPFAETAALLVVGEGTTVLPAWYTSPAEQQQQQLTELARQLATHLLPGDTPGGNASWVAVGDVAKALGRAGISADAACVGLTFQESASSAGALVWPAHNFAELFEPAGEAQSVDRKTSRGLDALPTYSRSLLRIPVPVRVTLASKKQPLARIVEIVPGSILQFDKPCDEALDLEVGSLPIAKGECVKVSDKFGLRITSLTLPAERFSRVSAPSS